MRSQHVSPRHIEGFEQRCAGAINDQIYLFDPFKIAAVTFEIGGNGSDRDPKTPNNEEEPEWECVWKCQTATPVHHMSFSPDGTLFATSGKSDRLVKIWYENKNGK